MESIKECPQCKASIHFQWQHPSLARKCTECGYSFPRTVPAGVDATKKLTVIKNPWLAALLNVVSLPLAFGYLYLGRPWRSIGTFLGAIVLAFLGIVGLGFISLLQCIRSDFIGCSDSASTVDIIIIASLPLLLVLYTGFDAWRLARRHNEELGYRQGGAGTAQGASQ